MIEIIPIVRFSSMKYLLLYSSRFGQTYKIAQKLKEQWERNSQDVTMLDLNDAAKINPKEYDKVIIGASIRYGHYSPRLYWWTQKNEQILNNMPTAFFSVSILATKPNRNTPESHTYTRKFFDRSFWHPQIKAIFAGELDYTKYNIIDRYLMKMVMGMNKGETDFNNKIEFTNWQEVKKFGEEVLLLMN